MRKTVRSIFATLAVLVFVLFFVSCGSSKPEIEITTNDAGFKQIESIGVLFQGIFTVAAIE